MADFVSSRTADHIEAGFSIVKYSAGVVDGLVFCKRINMEETGLDSNFAEQDVTAMVAAFYRRVRNDDLIGPMYPDEDWDGSEKRLRDFLIYRFGGSDRYIQERGHPRLRMRHAPFQIGIPERDRWLELMTQAMDEVQVPDSVLASLTEFFKHVADFMRNIE